MDVELRHLRAFAAVARSGSFTEAAGQLMITQPALSRTIQNLENELQVTLLNRNSRHVGLIEVGREFLTHAERVLADLEVATASVARHVTVRLGFSWLLPDPWAQRAVRRFEEDSGNTVTLSRCDDPLMALQQASIDVALVRGVSRDVDRATWVHLFDETRVAVCSERSALADRKQVYWNDIPQWPLVVNILSGTTGPWSWPDGHGPHRVVETANFDEWLESVAADRGIGVVPEVAMRRNLHSAVRFVPIVDAPKTAVSLVYLPGNRDTLIRRFVESAVESV